MKRNLFAWGTALLGLFLLACNLPFSRPTPRPAPLTVTPAEAATLEVLSPQSGFTATPAALAAPIESTPPVAAQPPVPELKGEGAGLLNPLEAGLLSMATDPVQPLHGWAVASDTGNLYVLDAENRLYELQAHSLTVLQRSEPLFSGGVATSGFQGCPAAFLQVSGEQILVGSNQVQQTRVLARAGFQSIAALDKAGRMALDPGRRLYLVSPCGEAGTLWAYNVNDWAEAPVSLLAPVANARREWPEDVVIDYAADQAYVRMLTYPGSHPAGEYRIYDLNSWQLKGRFGQVAGWMESATLASEAGWIATLEEGAAGPFGSRLLTVDRAGQELHEFKYLGGQPLFDSTGSWLYLLQRGELWLLNGGDLTLARAWPFLDRSPEGLLLAPEGSMIYLLGNGWLQGVDTVALRDGRLGALDLLPQGPFREGVGCSECGNVDTGHIQIYTSPTYVQDRTVYALVNHNNIYRSRDGGRSWVLPSVLGYPVTSQIAGYSLSPNFAADQTITAMGVTQPVYRSVDGGDHWEAWAPPLAFTSDRTGNREIYLADADGANVRPFTADPADDETATWSPGWTWIAYQSNRSGNWDIYSQSVNCLGAGCDVRALTDNPGDDLLPAWSPDGKRIAFVSTRDGNPELYLMNVDGSNQQRLTFNEGGDWRPAWREDGRSLIFTRDQSGSHDIYMLQVPAPGENPGTEIGLTPLVTGTADQRDPALFYNHLFYLESNDNGFQVNFMYGGGNSWANPWAENTRIWVRSSPGQQVSHPAALATSAGAFLIGWESGGNMDIYRVDGGFDSTNFQPVIVSPAFDGQPAWGPPVWEP